MIKESMLEGMNNQINEEMFSYYLYLSMSADFADKNLPGFANWMYVQALEEMSHAMRIYNFIIERGGKVVLQQIGSPQLEWSSPLQAFEDAYNHELHISECIDNLVDTAIKERDHASNNFLQWFVKEQVEEEASADEIVQKLKLVEGTPNGLYLLDQELAARTFVVPADMNLFGGPGGAA